MSYSPAPGTVAFRVLAYLQTLPAGAEVMTSKIADALGLPPNNIAPCLEFALKAGAIYRRQRDDHPRSPFWWSLVDHRKDSTALDAGRHEGGEAAQAPQDDSPGPVAASTPTKGRPPARKELTGGVGASLNGWPGNQGTRGSGGGAAETTADPEEYRGNSGAHDSRERPAEITPESPGGGPTGAGQPAAAGPAGEHGFVQRESGAGKLRIALWDDGVLQIYRAGGGLQVLLNPDETRQLLDYLDRFRGDVE